MFGSTQRKPIYVVGDHHGCWDELFEKIEKFDIRDCVMIFVGDGSIGFDYPDREIEKIKSLNNRFAEREIEFLAVRGNHDVAKWYGGNHCYSHFKLLPDYTKMEINGEKFLFIGGAVSVDRLALTMGVTWFPDEELVLDVEKIEGCDVLIMHTAPNWIGPTGTSGIQGWCKNDPMLADDCNNERKKVNEIFKLAKPKRSFHGHFHEFFSVEHDGCQAIILDIMDIMEYRGLR